MSDKLALALEISDANLHPSNITCLGVTTQRSTFITWAKDTGTPFHNFIVWKDMRSKALVKKWNQSLTFKVVYIYSLGSCVGECWR